MTASNSTYQVLAQLNALLADVTFPFLLPTVEEGLATCEGLTKHINDYLIPRLKMLDAPLLAVVGGSTGSGKSTIVNSLVAENLTKTGILRPTTTSPVLLCNPADLDWFMAPNILPEFGRTVIEDLTAEGHPMISGQAGVNFEAGTKTLTVVASAKVPAGLGIIDSPDIDSVREANHVIATQLFGAADLWIFVTTAARYADMIPWQYLARGNKRDAAMVVLLNRIPDGVTESVTEDCRALFAKKQLNVPVFPIEECILHHGRIGKPLTSFIRWMQSKIANQASRSKLIEETLTGALRSLPEQILPITKAIAQQINAKESYESIAQSHLDIALQHIHHEIDAGLALRTEVVEQFASVVGTSQFMGGLQEKVGRFRDTLWAMIRRKPMQSSTSITQQEIESALAETICMALDNAVEGTAQAWGEKMRDKLPFDPQQRDATREMIREMVASWRDDVMYTIRNEAEAKVNAAKVLTTGTNIAGVALMLLLFSTTGGITGGEVVVTGGTAVLSHGLLQAVFGDQALRVMTAKVRNNLHTRLVGLIASQHEIMCSALTEVPTHQVQRDIERCATQAASQASSIFRPRAKTKQPTFAHQQFDVPEV